MLVPAPNLTLTVTPPGGSPVTYTTKFAWQGAYQTPTITQNFGRQGDTALLPLVDDFTQTGTPGVSVLAESQIELYDHTAGTYLFAGVVNAPTQAILGPTLNEWDLNCTDYTAYADAAIVHGIFYGWTIDEILVNLTRQANCGITAVPSSQGGYVEPGPQQAAYVCNYKSLSTAWRELATLAGVSTPYGWFADQNLELHFFDSTTAQSSGVTFTTVPTTYGSTTEAHISLDSQNSYQQNATSLANRILVQGANQVVDGGSPSTSPATDTWLATGVQTAWPLRYTVSGTPTLYVAGVQQTVTVAASGSSATGAWVVEQNSVGSYFLIAATAPAAGVEIETWYSYQIPIVMQAQDTASQAEYAGPNGGVYAQFISDTSLTTSSMALARAQQMRQEYAFAAETLSFNSTEDFQGWVRAGDTCTVNHALAWDPQSKTYGVSDTFILTANTITFGTGGYRAMQVTAIRV